VRLFDLLQKYASDNRAQDASRQDSSQESSPSSPECYHIPVDNWPPYLREAYEERVAIMEFDGELPREEAERQAAQLYAPQLAISAACADKEGAS